MRLLVFGARGELGLHVVSQGFMAGFDIRAVSHAHADVTRLSEVFREVDSFRPDVVVNCAGIVRGREAPDTEYVAVNALAPYHIAAACQTYDAKMVQVSTDCVFSGKNFRRWYMPDDVPDPIDLYGRTKALGEVQAPHVAVVRTSFTGRTSRLWRWLESDPGPTVDGWTQVSWSGSTSRAVAEALVQLLANDEIPWGDTIHLATAEPIAKYTAVEALVKHLGRDLDVRGMYEPRVNMALCPTVVLPPFAQALDRE